MDVDPWTIALLAAAGFIASFIDAQVGGGGVITLPSLLLAGLPPHLALGTNKLGGTASALVASANYLHKGTVPLRDALRFAPLAFAGGLLGVWLVLQVDARGIVPVVMGLMVLMAAYVLLRPGFGVVDQLRASTWHPWAMAAAALAIGTYDGILGPGTGSFLLFAIVGLLGYGFRRAAGLGRILNLASNVAALGYFAAAGQVDWAVGSPMAASMALGGYVGSRATIRHGDRYLKPLFVAMTAVLLVSLLGRMQGWWPGASP